MINNIKKFLQGVFVYSEDVVWTEEFLKMSENFRLEDVDHFYLSVLTQKVDSIVIGDYRFMIRNEFKKTGTLLKYKEQDFFMERKPKLKKDGLKRLKKIQKIIDDAVSEAIRKWQKEKGNKFYVDVYHIGYDYKTDKLKVLDE